MFLSSLFTGKLSYGIEVYGALTEGQLRQLQLVQNRAARLAIPDSRSTTSEKFKTLNWLDIKAIRTKMDIVTLWKMRLHRSSPYFERWLRTSRIPVKDLLPVYEPDHGKLLARSFLVRATLEWNSLPAEIRATQPSGFKLCLKKYLLDLR